MRVFVVLLMLLSWLLPVRLGAQQHPTSASGDVPPDSLRRLDQSILRNDSTALRRYGVLPAQAGRPNEAHIIIIGRADRDSIVLRWAPSKPGAWLVANRRGYIVDRVTIGPKGTPLKGSLVRLSTAPLRPWSLEEWKRRAARENTYAAIAAQALYGKSFVPRNVEAKEGAAIRSGVDELAGRFGFSLAAADNDALVAEGLGLRWTDATVRAGERYAYRVYLASRDSSYHLDTAYVFATPTPFKPAPPPPGLTAEPREGKVFLTWKNDVPGTQYSGYYVYRSDDGGKTYHRLNNEPAVTLQPDPSGTRIQPGYTDTSAVNYRHYQYRVRGITPFAEESAGADIESFARDVTPPLPPVAKKPVQLGPHTVRIDWEMTEVPGDLAGFLTTRSADAMAEYHPVIPGLKTPVKEGADLKKYLLPPSARTFTDTSATGAEPYYAIVAVDTAGNLAQSLPVYSELVDTTVPSRPTGLAGTVDSNGVVRLHWHLAPEEQVTGYFVFWANDPRHEFSLRTGIPVQDTAFVDTVSMTTLTRHVYYKIQAVTGRYIRSAMSAVAELRRPTKIPPAPPLFTRVTVSDSSVTLAWAPSHSDELKAQELYRRTAADTAWRLVASLPVAHDSYRDTHVVKRTTYEYRLDVIDSSGLRSTAPVTVQGRPYDTGVRPGVGGLRATYDPAAKAVRVEWAFAGKVEGKYWFVVFRGTEPGRLMTYKSVPAQDHLLVDRELPGSGAVRYAVRLMSEDGGQSPLSEEASVQLK